MASDDLLARDAAMRQAAFDQIRALQSRDPVLRHLEIARGFQFEGKQFPFVNPRRRIFKPKSMPFLLSIRTVYPRKGGRVWFDDPRSAHRQILAGEDQLDYPFMGADPSAAENVWLRKAAEQEIQVIYFLGVSPGRCQAIIPTFVVDWDVRRLSARIAFARPERLRQAADGVAIGDAQAPGPGSHLRHLEWLLQRPIPDPELILYEILPYLREDADRIIADLCALARFNIAEGGDPVVAERIRQAFGLIVDAARAREALLELRTIEMEVAKRPWRDLLKNLRHNRREFDSVVRDRRIALALRWARVELGRPARARRRWLHYLRDHPTVLRKAINQALKSRLLRDEDGPTERHDLVVFIEGVSRAFRLLTNKELGRSVVSATKSRQDGRPAGPGVRLVSICLHPLAPDIDDAAVAWAIRRTKTRAREKLELEKLGQKQCLQWALVQMALAEKQLAESERLFFIPTPNL